MPKFYVYRKTDFKPDLLLQVECMGNETRARANYKYPWARTELYPGVFVAWAKGSNVNYNGTQKEQLKTFVTATMASGVYGFDLPEPTPPPEHKFEVKIDFKTIWREYLEGICLLTGAPEDSVRLFSGEALAKIVKVSKAKFLDFETFKAQEMETAEVETPVDAGDPAQFDKWCDAINAKFAAQLGFPNVR